MKDQQDLSRRKFVKGAAATGVAATGVGAFGGQAAAQQPGVDIVRTSIKTIRQTGEQRVAGLVAIALQNITIDVVDDIIVAVGGDVVEIKNVNVLNNNRINLIVNDVVDVQNNQISVNVLGSSQQFGSFNVSDSTTFDIVQE